MANKLSVSRTFGGQQYTITINHNVESSLIYVEAENFSTKTQFQATLSKANVDVLTDQQQMGKLSVTEFYNILYDGIFQTSDNVTTTYQFVVKEVTPQESIVISTEFVLKFSSIEIVRSFDITLYNNGRTDAEKMGKIFSDFKNKLEEFEDNYSLYPNLSEDLMKIKGNIEEFNNQVSEVKDDMKLVLSKLDGFVNKTSQNVADIEVDLSSEINSLKEKISALIATSGQPGPAGKDGKDGKEGNPGLYGIDGDDGLDGKDGAPGKNGVDGKDGAPGKNGVDGKDGVHTMTNLINVAYYQSDISTTINYDKKCIDSILVVNASVAFNDCQELAITPVCTFKNDKTKSDTIYIGSSKNYTAFVTFTIILNHINDKGLIPLAINLNTSAIPLGRMNMTIRIDELNQY
jgi:hypothetical protein